jgi:hypothetical protein
MKWHQSISKVKRRAGQVAPSVANDERLILISLTEAQQQLQAKTSAVKERNYDITLTGAESYALEEYVGTLRRVEYLTSGSEASGIEIMNASYNTQQAQKAGYVRVIGNPRPSLTYNYENGRLYIYPLQSTGIARVRYLPFLPVYDQSDTTGYWATFNATSFTAATQAYGPERALWPGVIGMEAYALMELLDQCRDKTDATWSMRARAEEEWKDSFTLVARGATPQSNKHHIPPVSMIGGSKLR